MIITVEFDIPAGLLNKLWNAWAHSFNFDSSTPKSKENFVDFVFTPQLLTAPLETWNRKLGIEGARVTAASDTTTDVNSITVT